MFVQNVVRKRYHKTFQPMIFKRRILVGPGETRAGGMRSYGGAATTPDSTSGIFQYGYETDYYPAN